jgi:(R,R)-butanediol dehydrogenase/meso-butanediol dehydrogenase/diacetyl reductase
LEAGLWESCIHCLRARGCERIYVSELTATRIAQNRKIADEVFNPIEGEVAGRCHELTGGEGVDVVFDCAGIQKAMDAGMDAGMDALRVKGTFMQVAAYETSVGIYHVLDFFC